MDDSVEDNGSQNFTLAWQNLEAYCQMNSTQGMMHRKSSLYMKTILNNLNGIAHSGQLLGVLGTSGSGKTTFLRALCASSTPGVFVSGFIYLNNKPVGTQERRKFAYLPPNSVFFGTLTVQEHLLYQALLKLDPSVPNRIKKERVENLLIEMNLKHCANKVIGIPPRLKGISASDKRKLAFATELLEPTQVITCDMPGSNLDADMAISVVSTLKQMALGNRVVICTLRQPVSEVMAMFSDILILWEGNVLFMGDMKDAFEFFNSIGFPFSYYYNPADHIIKLLSRWNNMLSDKPFDASVVCDQYLESEYSKKQILNTSDISEEDDAQVRVPVKNYRYKLPWFSQFIVLLSRSHYVMRREPLLTTIQLGQAIVIAFLFLILFWDQKEGEGEAAVHNFNSILFLIVTNVSFQGLLPFVFCFSTQMEVFLSEFHMHLYWPSAYLLARTIAELEVLLLVPVVYTTIIYWSSGLHANALNYLLAIITSCLASNISHAFGQMIACITTNVTLALSIVSFLTMLMMFFGGFYVHINGMPQYLSWMRFTSWFYYSYENLVINQWDGIDSISCNPPSVICFHNGTTVINSLGFNAKNMKTNFIMLAVLLILYRSLSFVFIFYRLRSRKYICC